MKKIAQKDKDRPFVLADGTLPSLGLLAGGATINDGVKDIRNKNILVSYGTRPDLGAGHKAPAEEIEKILAELKTEAKGKGVFADANVIMAPTIDTSGTVGVLTKDPAGNVIEDKTLSDALVKKIKGKKILTSIDTGWGITEPSSSKGGIFRQRAKATNFLNRYNPFAFGANKQLPGIERNTQSRIIFNPDSRSTVTGIPVSQDGELIKDLPKYQAISYGVEKPTQEIAETGGRLHYTGQAHPLVSEQGGGVRVLEKSVYLDKVHKYLQESGYDIDRKSLEGKRIITVSGASRGDGVGAKALWAQDQLMKSNGGVMPDDTIILGIGSGGVGRESQIARTSKSPGIFIGGRPGGKVGGPTDFVDLANNGDLHIMGGGGATPPEMLSHGGSPIAMIPDEQEFIAKTKKNPTIGFHAPAYGRSELSPEHGIYSIDEQARKILKDKGVNVKQQSPKKWMSEVIRQNASDPSNTAVVSRGLDGMREYAEGKGVREIRSNQAGGLMDALKDAIFMNKDRTKGVAREVANDITSGRNNVKEILRGVITKARKQSLLKGTGKLGLGALTIGSSFYPMISSLMQKRKAKSESMFSKIFG